MGYGELSGAVLRGHSGTLAQPTVLDSEAMGKVASRFLPCDDKGTVPPPDSAAQRASPRPMEIPSVAAANSRLRRCRLRASGISASSSS
jgi:hypothetical protein